jgi:hypothetical protein
MMPSWSFLPLFDEDFGDRVASKYLSTRVRAGRHKKDWRLQPNRIEPGEMLAHTKL